jgi:heme/copper-type cytochrome/quinol oxidase subunit 2
MISISLLKFILITILFYAALSCVTFHFFSTLFIFTLLFSMGCICFVSYREQKEKDPHSKKEQGWVGGGGAYTLSDDILGIVLILLFWGITSGMSQVRNELQNKINKFCIFLVLLCLASTGLSLGWLLDSTVSKFLM